VRMLHTIQNYQRFQIVLAEGVGRHALVSARRLPRRIRDRDEEQGSNAPSHAATVFATERRDTQWQQTALAGFGAGQKRTGIDSSAPSGTCRHMS
jgi:hypothetical protein